MKEPAYREMHYKVMVQHNASAEVVQLIAQVMEESYGDMTASQRSAVAAWFNATYAQTPKA